MTGNLPVYGPTEPFGDEEHESEVIVRVDFLMSREQIATALGMAWAEIAGDRNPEALTVVEVRHEVEAWLSVQAFHELDVQMERDAARAWSPERQRAMQLLAAAVQHAYPPHRERPVPAVQEPRYGDGTVTLQTLDRGEVTVPEPDWCRGHDGDMVGPLSELAHEGPEVAAVVDGGRLGELPFLRAQLTHAPFLEAEPEPHPLVYVEAMEAASFDADGLRAAAARLAAFAGHLVDQAAELDRLQQEGQS